MQSLGDKGPYHSGRIGPPTPIPSGKSGRMSRRNSGQVGTKNPVGKLGQNATQKSGQKKNRPPYTRLIFWPVLYTIAWAVAAFYYVHIGQIDAGMGVLVVLVVSMWQSERVELRLKIWKLEHDR